MPPKQTWAECVKESKKKSKKFIKHVCSKCEFDFVLKTPIPDGEEVLCMSCRVNPSKEK